jgi:hypothetical protein
MVAIGFLGECPLREHTLERPSIATWEGDAIEDPRD